MGGGDGVVLAKTRRVKRTPAKDGGKKRDNPPGMPRRLGHPSGREGKGKEEGGGEKGRQGQAIRAPGQIGKRK